MAARRRRSGYKGSYPTNYGQEAARRHIAEAAELSERLGGMDNEVKDFFFGLDSSRLKDVFVAYGRQFGFDKQDYAEQTFTKWKGGERKMSGLVAGRLFDLLPPIMPMDLKLRIVEGLFDKAGKKRTDHVLAPLTMPAAQVVAFVDQTLFSDLSEEGIDAGLKRQFKWLAGDDAAVSEKLLNHSLQVTFDAKKAAFSAIMDQFDRERENHADTITEVVSTIRLRQHEVRIKRTDTIEAPKVVDPMTFERGGREPPKADSDYGWLVWLGIGGAVLYFLFTQ
ncbi:hypothetical protein GGR95_002846 [Sulfitobacter undariae]|uniref:Uncharacterized protein n=1 Tax=Sulfitobacter undariae TaxID=1563671 RepID=A0A7W6H2U1_9RHOB|nr:hypothetical protein [Sulfitobacter undariae]MBB3995194.1 hypothetical protein [Sulfitobacter undariae]